MKRKFLVKRIPIPPIEETISEIDFIDLYESIPEKYKDIKGSEQFYFQDDFIILKIEIQRIGEITDVFTA